MGGSDQPENTTSTTTVELPEWIRPYSEQLLQRGVNVSRRPYRQYRGARVAQFTPYQQESAGMIRGAAQGQYLDPRTRPGWMDESSELRKAAGGAYLDPETNPWLRGMYDQSAQRIGEAYQTGTAAQTDAAAARARAFGGTGYQERVSQNDRDLGRTLSEYATNLYGGAYQTERDRQQQAQQALFGAYAGASESERARQQAAMDALFQIGERQRGLAQQGLDTRYQDWLQRQEWPLRQLDILGSAIGQSMGRSGTTTTQQPYFPSRFDPYSAIGGLGLGLAGLYNM